MNSSSATLDQVAEATRQVTRELPEAHPYTRFFRQALFSRAAQSFRDLVFQLDPAGMTDDAFERLPQLIEQVIKVLEIHVLASGERREFFEPMLDDLRIGLEGIKCGLPADPAKRPSRDDMVRRAGERALKIVQDRAAS